MRGMRAIGVAKIDTRTALRTSGAALVLAAVSVCTPAPEPEIVLEPGARVHFQAGGGAARWDHGIVGSVGECTAVLVPFSWDSMVGFTIVRIDSVQAIRVSTRYDGTAVGDERRRAPFPPDTAGETWRELPAAAVRARYGSCEPGL